MQATIKLNRKTWPFNDSEPLGPAGGFGCVYACSDGIAIKRLNVKAEHAKRELTLAETLADANYNYVVPVLDAGEDAESGGFYVVMARCEMSLEDHLKGGKTLPLSEAIKIIQEIAHGLAEVGTIVHRDLKPGNILKHDGHWKIADFGIARFVEETTSLNTMRECLTPPFAAPEQWRNERCTKSTDVYALGCISHILLTGTSAFEADDISGWQNKHLNENPKALSEDAPPKLRSLISLMLRKSPAVRPSVERVLAALDAVLDEMALPKRNGASLLASVDAEISSVRAEAEAAKHARELEIKRNNLISRESAQELYRMRNEMFKRISREASNAAANGFEISLGAATLSIGEPSLSYKNGHASKAGKWTVYNASSVSVEQRSGRVYRWESSLWFGAEANNDELRWYELSFMDSPFQTNRRNFEPYAADPDTGTAQAAFSNAVGTAQEAQRAVPIDGEAFEAFLEKWIERFGLAASGRLEKPRILPIN